METLTQLARTAPLVIVLLLASVGTASAECGWVLWLEHSYVSTGWKIIETAASEHDCRNQKTVLEKGPRPPEFYPETQLRYLCLPDTLDPRGPKRK